MKRGKRERKEADMAEQTYLARRKKVRKSQANALGVPVSDLEWRTGRLVYGASGSRVPDAEEVPKNNPKPRTRKTP
jgi:hypothetical protein